MRIIWDGGVGLLVSNLLYFCLEEEDEGDDDDMDEFISLILINL